MREDMDVRKTLFVDAIFNDWQDWRQGHAIFSRLEFVRLGNPSQLGEPRNVPIYRMPLYQGNRDTEPRYALLARIKKEPIHPFIVGVHLTPLVGERKEKEGSWPLPGKAKEAQDLRAEQAKRLIDLLEKHVLKPEEVAFLLGDFNAVPGEPCISSVLENEGFVRLVPTKGPGVTHLKLKAREPIDHIFVYPRNRLVEYQCWIIDTPDARKASDHLPVVADVTVR
jgi:endonuclease/exonuclease/phosphatase family metal-dependent hydrolase